MKLKKGEWYLFCHEPEEGEEPFWIGRYLEKTILNEERKVCGYRTYVLNPNGSKNFHWGEYDYCVPTPKLPQVKLR